MLHWLLAVHNSTNDMGARTWQNWWEWGCWSIQKNWIWVFNTRNWSSLCILEKLADRQAWAGWTKAIQNNKVHTWIQHAKGFLGEPPAKQAMVLQLTETSSHKWWDYLQGSHLKGHLLKLGLKKSLNCESWHERHCPTEARFFHLGYCMEPSDHHKAPLNKVQCFISDLHIVAARQVHSISIFAFYM